MTRGSLGGRPAGVACSTRVKFGAYSRPKQYPNVLKFWKKHNPGNYRRAMDIIQRYLRQLGWDTKHPRYNEILDVAVLTISRAELLMDIIERNYTRAVYDKSGNFIKSRPADQILVMEKLDDEIQSRLRKLGFFKINGNE